MLDHEQKTETSDHSRERRVRQISIAAITQPTAVAATLGALGDDTKIPGQHLYKPGDLVDYRRPAANEDAVGGWNGPCRALRHDFDCWQIIVQNGTPEVRARYPEARHTLCIEFLMVKEFGSDHAALQTVVGFIASFPCRVACYCLWILPRQGKPTYDSWKHS